MSLPFDLDPAAVLAGLRLPPLRPTDLTLPLPTSSAAAMASGLVYPPSAGQDTPRSEVDLDLALQLQELEINNLKDTVAMQNETTKDLRDTIAMQKEATQDFRDVIKDLRERNGDLQERNSDLSARNAAHVDQHNKLQETKIELAELRDDHVELIDNNKREEERVDELNAKVKEQDETIQDLQQQISSSNINETKQALYVAQLTRIIKRNLIAFQKLKEEYEELQVTYTTKTAEHSADMNDLSASYEAKEAELQELKDELQELRDYYKDHEELVKELTVKAKEQDKTIKELNTKVKQRDEALEQLQQQVQEKDNSIQHLQGEVIALRPQTYYSYNLDADYCYSDDSEESYQS